MANIKTKHVLRFKNDFDDRGLNTENADGKYRLFEIDGDLGEALLNSSDKIFIKGNSTEEAVMCTKNATFEIRKKESSNTVLLVPDTFETKNVFPAPKTPNTNNANAPSPSKDNSMDVDKDSKEAVDEIIIQGGMPNIYTMRKVAPRLNQLQALLAHAVYSGKMSEQFANDSSSSSSSSRDNNNNESKRVKLNSGKASPSSYNTTKMIYSFDELLQRVQCSEQELADGLRKFKAFELNDKWRVLDNDYFMRLSDTILSTILSNGVDIKAIKCSDVINSINSGEGEDEYDDEIIHHVLRLYSKPFAVKGVEPSLHKAASFSPMPVVVAKPVHVSVNEIQNIIELDVLKISIFRAKQLLSQQSVDREEPYKRWKLDEFLDAWKEQMYGLSGENLVSLDHCKKLAVIENVGPDQFIKRFYSSDLPTDVKDRFKLLFQIRTKWTEEDLKPFVEDIVAPGKSISSYLMKHTRNSMSKVNDLNTGKMKNVRLYSAR